MFWGWRKRERGRGGDASREGGRVEGGGSFGERIEFGVGVRSREMEAVVGWSEIAILSGF